MSWTAPPTFVSGTVLTAGNMNILAGDISFLAGSGGNLITTSESTTNTGYANLATVGPSFTVTTGGSALVIVTALLGNNTTGSSAFMSYNITGATAGSPSDTFALRVNSSGSGGQVIQASHVAVRTALTPGSNIFTAQYRVDGGTGTFVDRYINVIPLP